MGNQLSAQQYYDQAKEHIKQQEFSEAKNCLEQSLTLEEKPEAYHNLAVIHYMEGDAAKAIALFQSAVLANPEYHEGYINLARMMFETGQKMEAIEYCTLAIRAAPDEPVYKEELVVIVKGLKFLFFSPEIKGVFLTCLEADDIDHGTLAHPWLGMLKLDPDFEPFYAMAQKKDFKSFKKAFDKHTEYAVLLEPYFTLGLKRFVVADLVFEKFLTYLRRFLLESLEGGQGLFSLEGSNQDLVFALAAYCFNTRYIFSVSEEEAQKIEILRADIESRSGPVDDVLPVIVLACYQPLYKLKNADVVSAALKQWPDFVKTQIQDPLEELDIREDISSLTGINAGVSQDVQAQYEEFPYPFWTSLTRIPYYAELLEEWGAKADNILVAGCGTGKEALDLAAGLPDSNILAIDLSLSSLSYATRKAQEFNITNVTFKHADILELESLDMEFDIITSMGVLHHMEDPYKGWSVLAGKLRQGGYMHIALYSETARRAIAETRSVIAKKGYKSSAEGMKSFREECHKVLKKGALENIMRWRDFFSMPECRDLLFHVQEHRYTIPQIQDSLDRLGLSFIKFILPPDVLEVYAADYPDDLDQSNLEHWAEFENENMDTFRGMYDFWCHKAS